MPFPGQLSSDFQVALAVKPAPLYLIPNQLKRLVIPNSRPRAGSPLCFATSPSVPSAGAVANHLEYEPQGVGLLG